MQQHFVLILLTKYWFKFHLWNVLNLFLACAVQMAEVPKRAYVIYLGVKAFVFQ